MKHSIDFLFLNLLVMMISLNIPNKFLLTLVPLFSFTFCAIAQKCKDYQCNANLFGPEIRFPFRAVDHQPKSCGYPGFDVHCNGTQATLELPNSITFEIDRISYDEQRVDLSDPDGCLPLKIISLDLSTSHFYALFYQEFAVFNCSGHFENWEYNNITDYELHKVDCLSGLSYTVYAVNNLGAVSLLSTCHRVANVSVPDYNGYFFYGFIRNDSSFTLHWDEPKCRECDIINRRCRVRRDSTHEIECTSKIYSSYSGVLDSETSSKAFILSLGIGLPVFLVAIFSLLRWYQQRRQRNDEPATGSIMRQRNHTTTGISQSILDSYPTVVISEGGQLNTLDNNNTCPICLSEYKMNEVLKILPHCLHRFHDACINQWLVLDGTCPICRVVPSQSST